MPTVRRQLIGRDFSPAFYDVRVQNTLEKFAKGLQVGGTSDEKIYRLGMPILLFKLLDKITDHRADAFSVYSRSGFVSGSGKPDELLVEMFMEAYWCYPMLVADLMKIITLYKTSRWGPFRWIQELLTFHPSGGYGEQGWGILIEDTRNDLKKFNQPAPAPSKEWSKHLRQINQRRSRILSTWNPAIQAYNSHRKSGSALLAVSMHKGRGWDRLD